MVVYRDVVKYQFDRAAWIPYRHTERRQGLRDHASGSDNSPDARGDSLQNHNAGTEPGIILDSNQLRVLASLRTKRKIAPSLDTEVVIPSDYDWPRAKHDVVTDLEVCGYVRKLSYEDIVADLNLLGSKYVALDIEQEIIADGLQTTHQRVPLDSDPCEPVVLEWVENVPELHLTASPPDPGIGIEFTEMLADYMSRREIYEYEQKAMR